MSNRLAGYHKKIAPFILFLLLLFCLSACAPASRWAEIEPAHHDDVKGTHSKYLISPGDELAVKFFYYPELDDRIVVRPDGMIKLQLIPEVLAAGLTVSELNRKLTELYAEKIKQPEISVIMRTFTGQKIYVGGEVNSPRVVDLHGKMDVLQAILEAGGFKNTACRSSVVVISRDAGNRPFGQVVNIDGLINGSKDVHNIFLRPYDIIVVPKTAIAQLNLFVKQYIRNLLPIDTSFQATYNYSKIK